MIVANLILFHVKQSNGSVCQKLINVSRETTAITNKVIDITLLKCYNYKNQVDFCGVEMNGEKEK